jgi:putative hydrolase of the HAD superfamily
VKKTFTSPVVFFDLVGTLIRGTRPIGDQYAEQALKFGARADPSRLNAAFRQAMSAAPPMAFPGRSFGETAALEREWWTGVVRDVITRAGLSDALGGETFGRFFASLYVHFTTADAWQIFPDVLPALERLRRKGATLGLITNYDTRVFAVLDALGLSPLLTEVVIPAHVGAAKPDPAIFAHALRRAGVRAEDAVHVGDELDDDYRGAEGAGMKAVLLDRDGKCGEPGVLNRIESLSELVIASS